MGQILHGRYGRKHRRYATDLTDGEWAVWNRCFRHRAKVVDGQALKKAGAGWNVRIIKRSDKAKWFEALPRWWVVERTFAWLGRNHRLAKNFEASIDSSTAWLFLASVALLLRRSA